MSLKFSVSGLRGIVGESLTPEVLIDYLKKYINYIQPKTVVIGRDSRITGEAIKNLVISILNFYGIDVIDLDLVTTPTVEINVKKLKADGGIIITSSHNPIEWNALKFLNKNGEFLSQDEINLMLNKEFSISYKRYDSFGRYKKYNLANKNHIENIIKTKIIDIEKIKELKLKVGIDTVNSSGVFLLREFFEDYLDWSIFEVNTEITGFFGRVAEPTKDSLRDLENLVREKDLDIGFALDPDGDRLVLVDKKLGVLSEEYTLPLAYLGFLNKKRSDIVVNLSTSMLSDFIASENNLKVYRAKVGEINVSLKMKEKSAKIGGEGNGGVIYSYSHYGRDALSGIILILILISEAEKSLYEIIEELPEFYMTKHKIETQSLDISRVESYFKTKFNGVYFNYEDGIRIEKPLEWWFHIRRSNTEPIVRMIAEGKDRDFIEKEVMNIKEILV